MEENFESAPAHQVFQFFAHRKNSDGTFDSIYPYCFRIITRQPLESDLEEFEHTHVCNPEDTAFIH